MNLYKELGYKKTIKVLYNMEKDSVIARKSEKCSLDWICPVCGKYLGCNELPYCSECGSHLIYDESEDVYHCESWTPIIIRPGCNKPYLIYNIFGEKYYMETDEESNFKGETEEDNKEAQKYIELNKEEKNILNKICGRVSCKNCKYLTIENGFTCCKNDGECGNHRYEEQIPRYKAPLYEEKDIKEADADELNIVE